LTFLVPAHWGIKNNINKMPSALKKIHLCADE